MTHRLNQLQELTWSLFIDFTKIIFNCILFHTCFFPCFNREIHSQFPVVTPATKQFLQQFEAQSRKSEGVVICFTIILIFTAEGYLRITFLSKLRRETHTVNFEMHKNSRKLSFWKMPCLNQWCITFLNTSLQ